MKVQIREAYEAARQKLLQERETIRARLRQIDLLLTELDRSIAALDATERPRAGSSGSHERRDPEQ